MTMNMQPAQTAIVGCGVIRRLLIDHNAHYERDTKTYPKSEWWLAQVQLRDRVKTISEEYWHHILIWVLRACSRALCIKCVQRSSITTSSLSLGVPLYATPAKVHP